MAFNSKKLNSRGIGHIILPLAVVTLLAIVGVFSVVSSRTNLDNLTAAAAKAKPPTGVIKIKAYEQASTYEWSLDKGIRVTNTDKCATIPSTSKGYSKEQVRAWKSSCRVVSNSSYDVYVTNVTGGPTNSLYSCTYTVKGLKKEVSIDTSAKATLLSSARSYSCSPGNYTFFLRHEQDILTNKHDIKNNVRVVISKGSHQTIKLGATSIR